jgi:hypothetical protein
MHTRLTPTLLPPAAAKGKPSLKAGFLEGEMDVASYANAADDDYDFM